MAEAEDSASLNGTVDGASVQVSVNGNVDYRASALGGCFTSLVAARMEYRPLTPPEKLQKVYDAGHRYEDVAVAKMVEEGWTIWNQQGLVRLAVTGKLGVIGHIDGIVVPPCAPAKLEYAQQYVGEVKSQSEEEWKRFEQYGWEAGFWPKYKWQTSSYMHAYELPLCVVRVLRERIRGEDGQWIVTDRILDMKVEFVDEPFYSVSEIRSRILAVEGYAISGTIPQCDDPSWGCPYWYLPEHGEQNEKDRVELPDTELDAIAIEYGVAKTMERLAKKRAESVGPVLRRSIGDAAGKWSTVSGVKIAQWEQDNNPVVKWDQMVADGKVSKELVEEYTTQGRGMRMRVTLPKSIKEVLLPSTSTANPNSNDSGAENE